MEIIDTHNIPSHAATLVFAAESGSANDAPRITPNSTIGRVASPRLFVGILTRYTISSSSLGLGGDRGGAYSPACSGIGGGRENPRKVRGGAGIVGGDVIGSTFGTMLAAIGYGSCQLRRKAEGRTRTVTSFHQDPWPLSHTSPSSGSRNMSCRAGFGRSRLKWYGTGATYVPLRIASSIRCCVRRRIT